MIFLQGNRTELFLLCQDLSGVRVCSVPQTGDAHPSHLVQAYFTYSPLLTPSLVALQKLFEWKYCSDLLVVHNHPGYFEP